MTPPTKTHLTHKALAERIARIGEHFAIEGDFLYGEELQSGHINTTYRACYRTDEGAEDRYILQRINDYVFPDPIIVMKNVEKVTRHIRWKVMRRRKHVPGQALILYPARGGRNNNIDGTHTYDVVENTRQAYQAGFAFGSFLNLVADMEPSDLKEAIADFHHTPKRFEALKRSWEADVMGRAANCQAEWDMVSSCVADLCELVRLQEAGALPTRITHNDTKINNVMLDEETDEAVCVIDLDTVMPGLSLYDFGDMVRTATCMAREDEQDLSLVEMQLPFFESLAEGYLDAAHSVLTPLEVELMPFSGWLITMEIGIRFLTDYLDGDKYFRVESPEHNLVRARNQFALAASIKKNLPVMQKRVKSIYKSCAER